MPCCIEPVGGEIDQETRGDVQTTEREIQVGLLLVAVTVVAEMMMILAVVGQFCWCFCPSSCWRKSMWPLWSYERGVGKEMSCGWVGLKIIVRKYQYA